VGEETAANNKSRARLKVSGRIMNRIVVPLAPSLSPPGGARVATGRVRGVDLSSKTGWNFHRMVE
jgi:hypothetical protein